MRGSWRRRDDGAAAVEFALIVPLLLLITFGSIQYGFYFFQATAAEHAVREGARLASVGNLTTSEVTARVQGRAGVAGVASGVAIRSCFEDRDGSADYTRGDDLRIAMDWEPVAFGLPVPFLDDEFQTEQALTRVERVDAYLPGSC